MGRTEEKFVEAILFACSTVSIVVTAAILVVLLFETVFPFGGEKPFFAQVSLTEFLTATEWTPTFAIKHFGVLPLVCGTFLVAFIAALVGLPMGILSAIYLAEYSSPKTRSIVKPILEILSGLPTVVLRLLRPDLRDPLPCSACVPSLAGIRGRRHERPECRDRDGLMIMPMVCSLSEDALRAVPRSLREAGYALGSTKYDVSLRSWYRPLCRVSWLRFCWPWPARSARRCWWRSRPETRRG